MPMVLIISSHGFVLVVLNALVGLLALSGSLVVLTTTLVVVLDNTARASSNGVSGGSACGGGNLRGSCLGVPLV
ncbi:Uncharacterized protein HZ326_16255, partial [Fusarium oxysporum f. sp. albedinis]